MLKRSRVAGDLAIWVEPIFQRDALFDLEGPLNVNRSLTAWALLQERLASLGHECHTADVFQSRGLIPDIILFVDIPSGSIETLSSWAPHARRWAFLYESEVILPRNWKLDNHLLFEKIFTWSDPLIDGARYVKINFPALFSRLPLFDADKTGFCAVLAADKWSAHPLELYSERRRAIRWFEHHHPGELDLYGSGWEHPGLYRPKALMGLNRLPLYRRLPGRRYSSYQGRAADKFATLSRYRFSLCLENARDIPGYITEKLFDCLLAGTVPIYRGADNITAHVPLSCFIDLREFSSYECLYSYMRGLSSKEYHAYLEAGAEFLASWAAMPFTPEHMVEVVLEAMAS